MGAWLSRYSACIRPDLHVVERHVEGDVGIANEAVVADDGHLLLARGRDDRGGLLGVGRYDDERLDALVEQLASLLLLQRSVAVGGLDDGLAAELLDALDEEVAVALPALLDQRVEQQPDLDLVGALLRAASLLPPPPHAKAVTSERAIRPAPSRKGSIGRILLHNGLALACA